MYRIHSPKAKQKIENKFSLFKGFLRYNRPEKAKRIAKRSAGDFPGIFSLFYHHGSGGTYRLTCRHTYGFDTKGTVCIRCEKKDKPSLENRKLFTISRQ
jgi:hypothetical protein